MPLRPERAVEPLPSPEPPFNAPAAPFSRSVISGSALRAGAEAKIAAAMRMDTDFFISAIKILNKVP